MLQDASRPWLVSRKILSAERALPFIACLAIWLLFRPYGGITGDGLLYITRALADHDPQGVGADLMFVHDGTITL